MAKDTVIMTTISRRLSRAPIVNLCCAQCEAQIGIFENEWIRLTSSYARSKEKGSHFATQVGEKTQIVPAGPAARAADGCEMAEVFCRRCSNTVGQYCKAAPDTEKASLVGQYFYKLSRTYLKDSDTSLKVDPVFAFSPDVPSVHEGRSSTVPRSSMTPQRWHGTPLRQASSMPMSVQAATRNALRTQSQRQTSSNQLESPNDTQPIEESEAHDYEHTSQAALLTQHSNRISSQGAQLFEHAGRLRDMNARMLDQDNFLNEQAAQIQEQSNFIEEQNRITIDQGSQLKKISRQLTALQQTMDELRSSMLSIRPTDTTLSSDPAAQGNLIGHFESMVQSMKLAQSEGQELHRLREQNHFLSSRLESMTAAMGGAALEDSCDISRDTVTPAAQSLGKRKRDESDAGPSTTLAVSNSHTNPDASQETEQVPTPQSSHGDENTAYEQPEAHKLPQCTEDSESKHTSQISARKKRKATRSSAATLVVDAEPTDISTRRQTRRSTGALQAAAAAAAAEEEEVVTADGFQGEEEDMNGPTHESAKAKPTAHGRGRNENNINLDHDGLFEDADDVEANTFDPQDSDAANFTSQAHLTTKETIQKEDTFMEDDDDDDGDYLDENVEFSDEDEAVHDAVASSMQPVFDRDMRSLAPEPVLQKRRTSTPVQNTTVSSDRWRIATPALWSSATSNGIDVLKAIRPPAIKTKRDALHRELRAYGLEEWIPKKKSCKEYRDAVTAARASVRDAKRAQLLVNKGLRPTSVNPSPPLLASPTSTALSTIQNVPAAPTSQNSELTPGDENPHTTDKTVDSQSSGHAEASTSTAPYTRTRARRSSAAALRTPLNDPESELESRAQAADAVDHNTSNADENDAEEAPPAKHKRRSTGRAKSLRKSDIATASTSAASSSNPAVVEKGNKKTGRKPRKSAPAAMEGTNVDDIADEASLAVDLPVSKPSDQAARAVTTTTSATRLASPSSATSATSSRQKLLDKMKLRAQQEEAKIEQSQSEPASHPLSTSTSHTPLLVVIPQRQHNDHQPSQAPSGKSNHHEAVVDENVDHSGEEETHYTNENGNGNENEIEAEAEAGEEDEEALILARDKMAEEAMEMEMALMMGA